jgi:hypothetical protein
MNRFIASLVAIFCISGCAGFRQSRLPDVNPDELKSGAAMSGGAMTGAATAGKTAAKAAVGKRLLFLSTGWQFERNGTQIAKENYSQYQSYAESQRTIPGIFRESRSWQVVRDSAVADIDVDLQIHFKQNTKFGNMA